MRETHLLCEQYGQAGGHVDYSKVHKSPACEVRGHSEHSRRCATPGALASFHPQAALGRQGTNNFSTDTRARRSGSSMTGHLLQHEAVMAHKGLCSSIHSASVDIQIGA
jgi:hypothetical protein